MFVGSDAPARQPETTSQVLATSESGTAAESVPSTSKADAAGTERVTPRRASRSASFFRPPASRLESVPSGMPRTFAASDRETPRKSHSMRASRYHAGNFASSSCTIGPNSDGGSLGSTNGSGTSTT